MLVGNMYPLPYLSLILYWCWNITDISYSSYFTVQSPPHFCTGNTNLSSSDLKESLLDILLDHCSYWTVICFSEEYREMYAHSEATEHNHINCTNKMPMYFSWKVNTWSLPPLFSLKSRVLLKSYATLAFPSQKEKIMVEFCLPFLWIPEVRGSVSNLKSAKKTIQQTYLEINFKNGLGRSLNNQHSWTVFITHSLRILRSF